MSTGSVSFKRTMGNYNISNTFQLLLPKKFCSEHMLCHDHDVTLVDEREREYGVRFLISKRTLGRGWRDFVIAHGLRVGDELSFHLIDQRKFKVHITRFAESEFRNNVPVSLGKREDVADEITCFGSKVPKKYLLSCVKMQEKMLSQIKKRVHEEESSKEKVINKSPRRSTGTNAASGSSCVNFHDCANDDEHRRIELPAVDAKDITMQESDYDSTPPKDQSMSVENSESALNLKGFEAFKIHLNGENLDSEIPQDVAKSSNAHQTVEGESDSVEYSDSALTSMNFEDFKIEVNGKTLDSEIPPDARIRYYQLCCGEKKLIHDRVIKGINGKFAVSVILEIVRITDSVKTTTVSTAPHVLKCMEKTIRSFEELGFAVKTLRGKIGMLIIFLGEHQNATRLISEIESEGTSFPKKKAKIDDGLIRSELAQNGALVGNPWIKIDALKATRERLDLLIRQLAGTTW